MLSTILNERCRPVASADDVIPSLSNNGCISFNAAAAAFVTSHRVRAYCADLANMMPGWP